MIVVKKTSWFSKLFCNKIDIFPLSTDFLNYLNTVRQKSLLVFFNKIVLFTPVIQEIHISVYFIHVRNEVSWPKSHSRQVKDQLVLKSIWPQGSYSTLCNTVSMWVLFFIHKSLSSKKSLFWISMVVDGKK